MNVFVHLWRKFVEERWKSRVHETIRRPMCMPEAYMLINKCGSQTLIRLISNGSTIEYSSHSLLQLLSLFGLTQNDFENIDSQLIFFVCASLKCRAGFLLLYAEILEWTYFFFNINICCWFCYFLWLNLSETLLKVYILLSYNHRKYQKSVWLVYNSNFLSKKWKLFLSQFDF